MTKQSDVLEWLKANPDAFRDHPEWLEHINLPHMAGTASLIERQVERLRADKQELAEKLKQLTRIAADNEQLMRRLHELNLDVMAQRSMAAFVNRLFARLLADFSTDCVRLHMIRHEPGLDEVAAVITHDAQRPEWFDQTLVRNRIECGRLTRKKMQWLFGESVEQPGSAALIPIESVGVLAIGAISPERFHPGMGTLFLELLGTTLLHRLGDNGAEHRKRA
jgi:uncharacterized protein